MTASSSSAVSADPISVAVRSIHIMADGDRADFDPLYHPHAVDRENRIQPPSSRGPGPACFFSTALWLRAAFADLRYDIHHAVADGNLVAVNSTMNGCHVAPWAVYTDDGAVNTVFPPTNKTFAVTQSHWFRLDDGRIMEHWANRDDLGMAKQAAGFRRPRPTCSRWRGQSGALGILDLRHDEHAGPGQLREDDRTTGWPRPRKKMPG